MFPGALTELEPVPSGEQPSPGGTKEPQSGGDKGVYADVVQGSSLVTVIWNPFKQCHN